MFSTFVLIFKQRPKCKHVLPSGYLTVPKSQTSSLYVCLLFWHDCDTAIWGWWRCYYFHDLYFTPESPSAFGGVEAVYDAAKDDGKYQISRKKIRTWLKQKDVYTLHKPVRNKFRRNRVVVGSIDEEWEAELVIMESLSKKNNGHKYLTYCQNLRGSSPLKQKAPKTL